MRDILQLVFLLIVTGLSIACTLAPKVTPKHFAIERRWVRDTVAGQHLGFFQLHRFKPLLVDDLVIQANSFDSLVAYSQEEGDETWRLMIEGGVEGGGVVAGDRLFFGAGDGYFYAVNYRLGEVIWTFPMRAEGLATPTVSDGTVYFVAGNNVVYALDAETGQQKWLYTRQTPSNLSIRGASQPQVSGASVYVGFADGYLVALNKADGQPKWEKLINRNRRFKDVDAYPVVDGDRIYVPSYDGGLYCLDKSNGDTIWVVDEGGYSAITLSDERIYYSTTTNKIMALDKASGKTVWSENLKNEFATRPLLHRGLLIFGEYSGALRVLDARTGKSVALYNPGLGVTSEPTIHAESGHLYFMSKDANLFALKISWKKDQGAWPWETL